MRNLLVLSMAFSILCSCDNKPTPPPPQPQPPTTDKKPDEKPKDPGKPQEPPAAKGTGTISGKVVLTGKPPTPKKIKTDADPVCASAHKDDPLMSEEVVTKDVGGENRLQYAVVYISSAVGGKFEAPKEAVTIDQNGCHYVPHVLALVVGQSLKIRNSDPTMHNIHSLPQVNKEFNFGQNKAGAEETKTFDQPEKKIKFKCDVHPWMGAWAYVFDHPFFAVTREDGTFEIKNVPAGTHTLTISHEKYEDITLSVTVEDGKTAVADAKFEQK
jgi:plastocyanin